MVFCSVIGFVFSLQPFAVVSRTSNDDGRLFNLIFEFLCSIQVLRLFPSVRVAVELHKRHDICKLSATGFWCTHARLTDIVLFEGMFLSAYGVVDHVHLSPYMYITVRFVIGAVHINAFQTFKATIYCTKTNVLGTYTKRSQIILFNNTAGDHGFHSTKQGRWE